MEPRSLAIAVVSSSRSAVMPVDLLLDRLGLHVGAQVHRPHLLALLEQALEAAARLLLHLGRQLRRRVGQGRAGAKAFGDPFGHRLPRLLGLARRPSARTASSREVASAASAARAARSASADRVAAWPSCRPPHGCAASAASRASSASARRAAICAGAACNVACSACGRVAPCRQFADPTAGIGRRAVPNPRAPPRWPTRRAVRAACSRASVSRSARAAALPTAGRRQRARARSRPRRATPRGRAGRLRLARLREAGCRPPRARPPGRSIWASIAASRAAISAACARSCWCAARARSQPLLGTRPGRRAPAVRRRRPPDPPARPRRSAARAVAASSLGCVEVALQ